MKLLITGTAGFIGSHLVEYLLTTTADVEIVSLDALEYSGHQVNLESIPGGIDSDRHRFIHGSICDAELVGDIVAGGVDGIINLAAHTHVDRAHYYPELFIKNNIEGVLNLIRVVEKNKKCRFLQISTDEVYGAVSPDNRCDEQAALCPGNFYAASKAAADLYISAAINTDQIEALIIRGANNFGPRQYPEKMIPFFTHRVLQGEKIPLYGDGLQIRDWLYVADFCRAIWSVFLNGKKGEIYNAGAGNHLTNLEMSHKIIDILGADRSLISHVADRPGHDFCYAISRDKIKQLGWEPQVGFDSALGETVRWYQNNASWIETIMSRRSDLPDEEGFFERHYRGRL